MDKKRSKKELGQSIIEVVFSIGVVALVMTGSVILIINSVGLKNNSFKRKKATEMANLVVEDLINQKKTDSNFWTLENKSGETLANFDGFEYSVEYSGVSEGDCEVNNCVNAVITINWGEDKDEDEIGDNELEVSRFFSKKVE